MVWPSRWKGLPQKKRMRPGRGRHDVSPILNCSSDRQPMDASLRFDQAKNLEEKVRKWVRGLIDC